MYAATAIDVSWFDAHDSFHRQCQTKTAGSTNAASRPASGSKLTPLREGSGAIELEILAAVEVAFLVEVIVN